MNQAKCQQTELKMFLFIYLIKFSQGICSISYNLMCSFIASNTLAFYLQYFQHSQWCRAHIYVKKPCDMNTTLKCGPVVISTCVMFACYNVAHEVMQTYLPHLPGIVHVVKHYWYVALNG